MKEGEWQLPGAKLRWKMWFPNTKHCFEQLPAAEHLGAELCDGRAAVRSRNTSQGVNTAFANIWETIARKDSIKVTSPKSIFMWK